jgi:hypothetical protein
VIYLTKGSGRFSSPSHLRGVLSFASHGIHDVSGENSLFWRVTGGRYGLAFHPLPLDATPLCIASFFLSMEAPAFSRSVRRAEG